MDSSGNQVKLKPNPEAKANVLSRLFFCFINPLLRLGFKRSLETTDFYEVLAKNESHLLCEKLDKEWKLELKTSKEKGKEPNLRNAIYNAFGRRFMLLGLVLIFEEIVKITQPVFMGGLIRYFRFCSTMSVQEAYLYAFGLSICALMLAIWHHPYFYLVQNVGMQIRVACSGLVYKKIMTLSSGALRETEVGKIVNMLSNDVARFDQIVIFLHYFWIAPLGLIGFIALLWHEIGPSCLAGFGCLILLVPLQGVIGRQMGKYRREVAGCADKRIGIMSEILNGIRVIKMYAWEIPFAQLVDDARKKEIKKLKVQALFQALLMGLFFASGKLIVLCAIVAFVLSGETVGAEKVFVASALFNTARLTVTLFLPFAIQFYAESKVTIKRIQDFLVLEDKEDACFDSNNVDGVNGNLPKSDTIISKVSQENLHAKSVGVDLVDFSAKWTEGSKDLALDKVSFSVKPGELLMIVGPVGAGKSTVLYSLLGETKKAGGSLSIHGKIAFVPQQAWIFSATVRQNVSFGRPVFDQSRYHQAVGVCALKKDMDVLPYGDLTVVGDRGVALSGGQRARVSFARAVYSDADIYLLDDPMSAVDSAVGRFIFEKCILKHLANSVRILVTHQLQYLKYATKVIVLKQGKVVAVGTFNELQKLGDNFTSILKETEESYRRRDSSSQKSDNLSPRSIGGGSPINVKKPLSETTPRKAGGLEREYSLVDDDVPEYLSPVKRPLTEVFEEDDFGETRKTKSLSNLPHTLDEKEKLLQDGDKSFVSPKKDAMEPSLAGSVESLDKREVPTQIEDERTAGTVSWRVYFEYFRAMANPCCVILLFLFCIFVQVVFNFSDWWLNVWASTEDLKMFLNESDGSVDSLCYNSTLKSRQSVFHLPLSSEQYLYSYSGMIIGLVILSLLRAIAFRLMLNRASFVLHSRMFSAIIRTPVLFFDRNPVGRILNRFSKDTGTMDELLAFVTFDFIQGVIVFVGILLVVGILNPYVFIPTVPLSIIFVFARYYYMKTARVVKRLEATTRSPVFSHVSSTLNGLTTIRAFQAEKSTIADFHSYQNMHTSIFSAFLSTSRWFALVIDWLCSIFVAVVAFISVWSSETQNAGSVGLSLFYALSLMGFFQWIIRQSTEMESMMVSVERILEYSNLPAEGDAKQSKPVPTDWPKKGEVTFDNVSLRYAANLPFVVKDVSFVVKPCDKVGIVGRTGAGKSSILNALFRLCEPDGIVKVDGIDIKYVDLPTLRKRLSIIPQDPVLFIGTLRKNLDPFNEFSTENIWDALEQVELKPVVREYELGLESLMQEGGANLSVGQRQLVCLARALLRRNKVLVIDEATANVDLHTDALIQRTIRVQFKDCTVLTIAHRLNTIMDCNRVMVLQDGKLIEFDEPALLLHNPESIFTKLVEETGPANAKILKNLAEKSYKSRN